jgi:type II secretion system protein N
MRITRILSCCGYLLYTVVVLAFMLWLQFPAAAIKAKAEAELNRLAPDVLWQIGAVSLALPADIRFNHITVSSKGTKKEPLFVIDSFTLRPDLTGWQHSSGTWSVLYQMQLFGGSISGRLAPVKTPAALACSGELKDIRLDSPGLKNLLAAYGRTVSGTLSGSFNGRHDGRQGLLAELQADLSVSKGAVSLQEPLAVLPNMHQLAFDLLRWKLQRQANTVRLEGGKIESKLLEAEFSGDIRLIAPAAASVQLKGGLKPRPELMASLGGPQFANMLKSQLRDGKLPFTVSGTVQQPGISFPSLPAGIRPQLRGGRP